VKALSASSLGDGEDGLCLPERPVDVLDAGKEAGNGPWADGLVIAPPSHRACEVLLVRRGAVRWFWVLNPEEIVRDDGFRRCRPG
jgi:hypothetical protein